MSVIKEWFCGEHGPFDASHAICPHIGCESAEVVREFRTAPGFKSDGTKRTDAGLQRTMESFGYTDLKSAKVGESAKPNNRSNELLWGDEAAKMLGKPIAQATAPVTFDTPKGKWTDRGGIFPVAQEIGTDTMFKKGVERTFAADDQRARKEVTTK